MNQLIDNILERPNLQKIGILAATIILLAALYYSFLYSPRSDEMAKLTDSVEIARNEKAAKLAIANGETVARLAAMPRLANPFGWDCVFETDRAMYRFNLSLLGASAVDAVRYEKPGPELSGVVDYVSQQRSARIFLNFARFPVLKLADPGCTTRTLVQLADLRYTEPGRSRGSFAFELPIDCSIVRSGR